MKMLSAEIKSVPELFEALSDAPRGAEDYIEYMIRELEIYRRDTWSKAEAKPEVARRESDQYPTSQSLVRFQIGQQIFHLGEVLRRLRRERSR